MMTDNAGSIKEQGILDQASKLILTVKESYQNGTAIHAIEKKLFEAVVQMGHKALGLLFELCDSGDVGQVASLDDGREVNRLPALHVKPYLSIFGPFDISRYVYGSREGQKIEYDLDIVPPHIRAHIFQFLAPLLPEKAEEAQ